MFIVCICQCESTGDNKANPSKKQLEEIEELNEDQREKELIKVKSRFSMLFFLYSLFIVKSECISKL
jgi:hypothetical protein